MTILKIFILFIFSFTLLAKEMVYLARSPKALLMGDAYTAVADDEYTLFYNPAALGGNKGVSFTPLDPTFGVTDVYSDISKFQNFPTGANAAPLIAQRIMDYPIYLQASAFPTLKMAQFGMSLFLNSQTSMVLRNATNPVLDVNYQYDRGFIAGFALNIGDGALSAKPKKNAKASASNGDRLSVGMAVKHLNRQGLNNQFDLFGTTLLNSINSGAKSASALQTALGYSSGTAWGYDIGAEYAHSAGNSVFKAGYSLLDIGGTRFTKTSGNFDVPTQPMFANIGTSFKQDFGVFDYTISSDLHPFMGPVDFSRQFHFGFEFGLPFVTVLTGWSEGYVSYGVCFKFWPFKITTGLYGVETGSSFREAEAKRFILYLSLFDFSIDL